jgi:parallel beta-helix repeat protein
MISASALNGDNNLVEENTAYGNTNGIVSFPAATNTRIRGNVAVGNPSIQLSTGVPGSVGVDIWDQSPRGATSFDNNLCIMGRVPVVSSRRAMERATPGRDQLGIADRSGN